MWNGLGDGDGDGSGSGDEGGDDGEGSGGSYPEIDVVLMWSGYWISLFYLYWNLSEGRREKAVKDREEEYNRLAASAKKMEGDLKRLRELFKIEIASLHEEVQEAGARIRNLEGSLTLMSQGMRGIIHGWSPHVLTDKNQMVDLRYIYDVSQGKWSWKMKLTFFKTITQLQFTISLFYK
jgi:hypothetical protein